MKISAFITISNPIERQDPFQECLKNMLDFADEVVVVDGGQEGKIDTIFKALESKKRNVNVKIVNNYWPENFDWKFIGEQFNRGYEACTGDWVFRFDADYQIHENDFQSIRDYLKTCDAPACTMPKKQFLLVDRYRIKSLTPIAYNKGKYGNRIKLNAGGDLCAPSLDGIELKKSLRSDRISNEYEMLTILYPNCKYIPFWNYDFSFKTKEVIEKDWKRFRRAWEKQFKSDFGEFLPMMIGRLNNKGWQKCDINEHPKYIQNKIKNITKEQFGFDVWGNFDR